MPETHPHAEWSGKMFDLMREANVKLFAHVPDAGNDRLIALAEENNNPRVGERAVLCMQSSGLGNCPNYLSLAKGARFPLLMMISMRGDYGEQNPWQYPMANAVEPLLEAMGVLSFKVEEKEDLEKATIAALHATGKGAQAAAIILSQKFLGAKGF